MIITQMISSDDEIEFLSVKPHEKIKRHLKEEVILSSDDDCDYKKESVETKQELSDSENDNEDEDDDENLPSGAECMKRCKEFASITETDTALAMFYLQNNKWDLEATINAYFASTKKNSGKKVVACFDVEKLDRDEKRKKSEKATKNNKSDIHEQLASNNDETNQKNVSEALQTTRFKVLSWNIDGIDDTSLEARATGVSQKILAELPDVILLQEVVNENEIILRESLSKFYEFNSGDTQESNMHSAAKNYYTMILTKKQTCKFLSKQILNYENSVMGRNLLKVKLNYAGKVDICVMTTHLESTKEYSKQRIDQLRKGFKEALGQDKKTLVIFGGDLNLRDNELDAIGGLPNSLHDLWESTGSRKECLYTWDTSRNTNLQWPGKFKPKLRFDRIYFRPNECENTLVPVYFELEGLEKLKTCSRFCSDHWAVQSYFDLKFKE